MNRSWPPPSPDDQLGFLVKFQRLFNEGEFTATYKFALIIAMADLALEQGMDDGSPVALKLRQIAERFIELYWRHADEYVSGQKDTAPGVLSQNLGKQAAVLSAIERFQSSTGLTQLTAARAQTRAYKSLVTRVARTVSEQPLTHLQNFNGGTDPFLYQRTGDDVITLGPGVAYCLRRFYPLIQRLARTGWVAHIKGDSRNQGILGQTDDLADFLFTTTRESMTAMKRGLLRLDGKQCFYCGCAIDEADVDHFLPFSLYPRDLAHNLVLSHPKCNRSKSDTLAARRHLERWVDRIDRIGDDIAQIGLDVGIKTDITVLNRVGRWAYEAAATAGAKAWISPKLFETVDAKYFYIFRTSQATQTRTASDPQDFR